MIGWPAGRFGGKRPESSCHDRAVVHPFSLEPCERLLVVVGRSPTALVMPAVRLIALSAGAGYLAARVGRWLARQPQLLLGVRIVLALLVAVLVLRWVVRPFRSWSGQYCGLTTHRVVIRYHRKGSDSWSIPYGMITHVDRVRTGRLALRANTLRIQTTLSSFPAQVPGLGRSAAVAAALEAIRLGPPPGSSPGRSRTDLRVS